MTSLHPREAVLLIRVPSRTVSDRPRGACGRMSQPSLVGRRGAHLDPGGLFLQPKCDAAIPRLLEPRRTWLISSPFA